MSTASHTYIVLGLAYLLLQRHQPTKTMLLGSQHYTAPTNCPRLQSNACKNPQPGPRISDLLDSSAGFYPLPTTQHKARTEGKLHKQTSLVNIRVDQCLQPIEGMAHYDCLAQLVGVRYQFILLRRSCLFIGLHDYTEDKLACNMQYENHAVIRRFCTST